MRFLKADAASDETGGSSFTSLLLSPSPSSSSSSSSSSYKGMVLFAGTKDGRLAWFTPSTSFSSTVPKYEKGAHTSEITCLMTIPSSSSSSSSLLVSGSRDRTIKIWTIPSLLSSSGKGLVQTLFGHIGGITGIVDGDHGVIVSCSVDGSLRVWSPQRGRDIMLHPFYECTFLLQISKTTWLTALAINTRGHWSCYVGDSNGTIEIFRKGLPNSTNDCNDKSASSSKSSTRVNSPRDKGADGKVNIEKQIASYAGQLTSFRKWDNIHRLGISSLKLMTDEGLMISLSFDCSCKISDATLGHTFYSLSNPQRCMYTGCIYLSNRSCYLLTDELGHIEVYNPQMEKSIHRSQIMKCKTSKQHDDILSSHKDPLITTVTNSMIDDQLVILEPSSKLSKGEISFWQLHNDTSCVEFVGHEGLVIDIGVLPINDGNSRWETTRNPSYLQATRYDEKEQKHQQLSQSMVTTTTTTAAKTSAKTSVITKDEFLFFSAADDQTIRCWDQFDYKENYTIKNKGFAQISAMHMIWGMNMIATGHESGLLSIWHADAGTKVTSHALKSSVTCIVEAKNIHSNVLIGSDYSGMIAIWNLTLLAANPSVVVVDTVFRGFHNIEDPSILSMCWHNGSRNIITGGIDRSIKFWHLGNENANSIDSHKEGVCCLSCTDDYLVSGDEECHFYLWKVVVSSTIPTFAALCHWPPHASSPGRAIGCLSQIDKENVNIVLADSLNKTVVWKVSIVDNSAWAAINYATDTDMGTSKTTVDLKDDDGDRTTTMTTEDDDVIGVQVYHSRYPDLLLSAVTVVELNHSENEISSIKICTTLSLSLRFVYLGTLEGPVLRYEIL